MSELSNNLEAILQEKNEKIVAGNIKEGVQIFDVVGGFTGGTLDTTDATATAKDIVKDKTAYVNGEKVVGELDVKETDCNVKIDIASYAGQRLIAIMTNTSTADQFIKKVDFSKADLSTKTSLSYMFYQCYQLSEVLGLKADDVENMSNMFKSCGNLQKVEISNTNNLTNTNYMFENNSNLTDLTPFDTSKVENFAYMFSGCIRLPTISLDLSSANIVTNILFNCTALTDILEFKNLGKGYTEATTDKIQYKLDLSYCTSLTHESLMNVINGLYDLNITYNVANGGTLYTQTLALGATNKAKLTAEEIAIATSKGWNVS